jgi:hypothetical protein
MERSREQAWERSADEVAHSHWWFGTSEARFSDAIAGFERVPFVMTTCCRMLSHASLLVRLRLRSYLVAPGIRLMPVVTIETEA